MEEYEVTNVTSSNNVELPKAGAIGLGVGSVAGIGFASYEGVKLVRRMVARRKVRKLEEEQERKQFQEWKESQKSQKVPEEETEPETKETEETKPEE